MFAYGKIMRIISKVESLEKYLRKGDIFDAKFYIMQLNGDILKIMEFIEKQLTEKIESLNSLRQDSTHRNIPDISLQKNSNIQEIRINRLKAGIEMVLKQIHILILKVGYNESISMEKLRTMENDEEIILK